MNKKGFTLTEILAVIALIGVIISLAIPGINAIRKRINERNYETKKEMLLDVAELYVKDNNIKEDTTIYVYELLNSKYINKDIDQNDDNCKGENTEKGCIINPIDNSSMNNEKINIIVNNKKIITYWDGEDIPQVDKIYSIKININATLTDEDDIIINKNIIKIKKDEKKEITITPNYGYDLTTSKIECDDNSISVAINQDKLSISNASKNTTCTITLNSNIITLRQQVLTDNPNILERTDFSTALTGNNTGQLYKTTKTEDGSDVYYFAGNALNNWVVFGSEGSSDICWRIIRTNTTLEGNGIRLLYSGKWDGSTCGNTSSAYLSLGEVLFVTGINYYEEDPSYNGYMYTNGKSLEEDRKNEISSEVKNKVDDWFKNNTNLNESNQLNKINKKAIYCNDRSLAKDSVYSSKDEFNYSALYRIGKKSNKNYYYSPSLKCGADENNQLLTTASKADKFTVDSSTGNGKLKYPIALITADELAFAGGVSYNDSVSNKAWYYNNNSKGSITGRKNWWTMTPDSYWWADDDWLYNCMFIVNGNNGTFFGESEDEKGYIRPVISLIENVEYLSGNGSPVNPYRIK